MKNITIITVALICSTVHIFAQKKPAAPITLEGIWSGQFDQKDILPQLMNTKPAVAFIRADKATNFEGILTLDLPTGKIIDTIFTNQTKVEQGEQPITFTFFEDFTFSPDDSKILIRTEKQGIYRTSHKEFVFVWDENKKTLKPVSTDGKISAATFSPNNKYISFVRDANLYIRNIETDKITAITTDGAAGAVINAIADEVYEDGFGLHSMYAWNEESTKIAFIKINQNYVKRVPLTNYERNEISVQQRIFAKAGETVSEASVYVYDITTGSVSKMDVGTNINQYITNFKWASDGKSILIERLSRNQRNVDVIQCYATNGNQIKIILSETSESYIKHQHNNIKFVPDGKSFFWLSEQDGFNHIYQVDIASGKRKQITKGKWEVNNIASIDTTEKTIYYLANTADVTTRHLYKANYTNLKKQAEKLTIGTAWHDVMISNDVKFFFDKATTINAPFVYNIYKTSGKEISNKALIENKRFHELIDTFNFKKATTFSIKNKNGTDIDGWVIDANNKNIKGPKPLLLYVYGSNNKQEVTQEWNNRMAMTFRYFSNLGFVVACIDPSGTPGKGTAFRNLNPERLSQLALDDIVAAKNYLVSNYNIDKSKTNLMGWSYGGFLTTMAATKYAGLFNKYIAIAPVTNWRDYNAPFTERILGVPADNSNIYKNETPIEHVDNYKGGLLLVHGSYDDNVHLQHSMKLAKALTESDYYYDIQIFTDKGHSLSDGQTDKTRMNLFKKITKFLQRIELD